MARWHEKRNRRPQWRSCSLVGVWSLVIVLLPWVISSCHSFCWFISITDKSSSPLSMMGGLQAHQSDFSNHVDQFLILCRFSFRIHIYVTFLRSPLCPECFSILARPVVLWWLTTLYLQLQSSCMFHPKSHWKAFIEAKRRGSMTQQIRKEMQQRGNVIRKVNSLFYATLNLNSIFNLNSVYWF